MKKLSKGKIPVGDRIELISGSQKVRSIEKVQVVYQNEQQIVQDQSSKFNQPQTQQVYNQENPMGDALNGFFATISNSWNSMNSSGKIFFISIILITILVPFIVCGVVLVRYLRRDDDEYSDYDYDGYDEGDEDVVEEVRHVKRSQPAAATKTAASTNNQQKKNAPKRRKK